jgi:hypothetical protein
MKTESIPVKEAEEIIRSRPARAQGKWTEICTKVCETGVPVKVTDITHGQVAALRRTCKEKGLRCVSLDKNTGALVLLPEKAKGK